MHIEEQYDKIYRFCYYRVRSREIAEDITQETFLRFMSSDYEERGEKMRYLYTIARNLCIDESRNRAADELPDDISDNGAQVEKLVKRIEVRRALSALSEDERELLILRYLNEEPVADICRITGMSRFALYRKLNRVKREFIRLLDGGKADE